MNSKNKKIGLIFLTLLVVAGAVTWLAMPKADVQAYQEPSGNEYARYGELIVKAVDENGTPLNGANIKVNAKRTDESGNTVNDPEQTATIGTATIGNEYLDQVATSASTAFFSYEAENRAEMTITGNGAPEGYKDIGDIVLDYKYLTPENENFYGGAVAPNFCYVLNVSIKGGSSQNLATVSEDNIESRYYGFGGINFNIPNTLILTIKYLPDTPQKTGNLTIKKELAGNDTDSTKEFTFNVTLKDSNDVALANKTFGDITTSSSGIATVNLKGSESATISGLPDGTKYSVEEVGPDDGYTVSWADGNGVAIPGNPFGEITVGDSATTVSYTATNTKNKITPATAAPKVEKVLTGDTPATDEKFKFNLTAVSNKAGIEVGDMPMPTLQGGGTSDEVTVTGEGEGTFANISFNKAGEYTYKVSETPGNTAGYTYDDQEYTIKYTVTLIADDNKYNVSQEIIDENGNTVDGDSCTFTNTYTAPEEPKVEVSLPIEKVINGDTTEEDSTFTFAMKAFTINGDDPTPDMPMPDGADNGQLNLDIEIPAGENLGEGNFGDITFTEPGEYVYEISEEDSGAEGFTYDTSKYRVMWKVTTGVDDVLEADMTIADENGTIVDEGLIKFTNTFEKEEPTPDPEPVDLEPVSVTPSFEKVVTGAKPDAPASFKFIFTALRNDADINVADMPMPGGVKGPETSLEVKGPGSYKFGNIEFTTPGEYTYTLQEEVGKEKGYAYDSETFYFTWIVTEKDGALDAQLEIKDSNEAPCEESVFSNRYTSPTSTDMTVEKTVKGDTPDAAGKFEFTLKPVSNNAGFDVSEMPMPADTQNGVAKINAEGPGSYNFGDLTFTRRGDYTYEVREVNTYEKGYTYDDEVYTVTWSIARDEGTSFTAKSTIKNSAGEEVKSLAFANTYAKDAPVNPTPEPVIIDPPLQKLVTGDEPMDPGSFTFVMRAESNTAGYEVADMPMPEGAKDGVAKHTVEGPGSYEFGEYTITKPGHYVYSLNEENVGEEGYTYDTTRYTIFWNITEVDGKLVAEKTIADQDGKLVESASFTNNFSYDNSPLDPDDNDDDVIDETQKVKKTPVKTKAAKTGDLSALTFAYALLIASLLASIALRRRTN